MSEEPFLRPDVLVLAAGGAVGEAWMTGVLAGIESESGIDFRACDCFVGTSAGSIVSAHLAAGRSPRRPEFPAADLPEEPPEMTPSLTVSWSVLTGLGSVLALALLVTRSAVAAVVFAAVVAILIAGGAVVLYRRPVAFKPLAFAGFAVAVCSAGFLAWWDALRGTRMVTWEPTPRPTVSTG